MKHVRKASKVNIERAISKSLRKDFPRERVCEAIIGNVFEPERMELLLTDKRGRTHGGAMVHVVINELSDMSGLTLDEQRKKCYEFFDTNAKISKAISSAFKKGGQDAQE